MSSEAQVRTLLSEIEKGRAVLGRIRAFYEEYLARTDEVHERTSEQAIVLAEIFVSYYTCLETVFLRVSQHFENHLDREKWHQELLHRMTLRIEGIREPVVTDATAALLSEMLKFRHFKRYYFQFEYDWDRLAFVRKKCDQLHPLVMTDLDRFVAFLRRLLE